MKEGKFSELSSKATKATEEIKHQWLLLQQKKQKEIDDKIREVQKRDEELNDRLRELSKMEEAILNKEEAIREKEGLIESIKKELESEMENARTVLGVIRQRT